jgi:hypothetical protein
VRNRLRSSNTAPGHDGGDLAVVMNEHRLLLAPGPRRASPIGDADISLFAVAIQTGIIMAAFIQEAIDHKTKDQTYIAMQLSRVQVPACGPNLQPFATPSIGGMVTWTIHVLFSDAILVCNSAGHQNHLPRRSHKKLTQPTHH